MTPTRDALIGSWWASPELDEFVQKIEFRDDGTGALVSGGGQAICLEADFVWDLGAAGLLALRFQKSGKVGGRHYVPAPSSDAHELHAVIETGEFPLHVSASMGTITYKRRLRFDQSPLPKDAGTYHSNSLFFSVVNKIDPRSFLVFYEARDSSEVALDPRPELQDWRERLSCAKEFQFARIPGAGARMTTGARWVRVIAGTRFLLEAGWDHASGPVRWFQPGTATPIGALNPIGSDRFELTVDNQVLGEGREQGSETVLTNREGKTVAIEKRLARWISRFDRPAGAVMANRSAPVPTLEREISELELMDECTDEDRLLLIAACLVAGHRDG